MASTLVGGDRSAISSSPGLQTRVSAVRAGRRRCSAHSLSAPRARAVTHESPPHAPAAAGGIQQRPHARIAAPDLMRCCTGRMREVSCGRTSPRRITRLTASLCALPYPQPPRQFVCPSSCRTASALARTSASLAPRTSLATGTRSEALPCAGARATCGLLTLMSLPGECQITAARAVVRQGSHEQVCPIACPACPRPQAPPGSRIQVCDPQP